MSAASIRSTCARPISTARAATSTPYGQTVEDTDDAARDRSRSSKRPRDYRARRARDRGLQRGEPDHQARHRADAGEVRHLLHADPPQSGRRAGPRLYRRLDPSQPRRHRDGAGAVHQGGAGRRRGIRRADRLRPHHRDQHRQSARTPRRPPLPPAPTSTAWRRRSAPAQIKQRMVEFAGAQWGVERRGDRLPRRARARSATSRCRSASSPRPAGSTACNSRAAGYYKTPEIHWDRRERDRPAVPLFRLSARPAREVAIDTLTGEMRVAARRHPPRRRLVAQSGDRHRPDRGRLRAGHGLADDRGTGVRRQGPAARPMRPRPTRFPVASDVPADFRTTLHLRPNHRRHHLSLQGGRRAAADAADLGLFARSSTRSMRSSRDRSRGSRRRARRRRS